MSEADQERQQAQDLPEGDVVRVLLEQHAQIRQLFASVQGAAGQDRQRQFDQLRLLLARHETAEEMIVRPVTRSIGAEDVAQARNDEEDQATHVLAELEKLDASSAEFDRMLGSFEQAVSAHAQHEEDEEFPRILSARDASARVTMGQALLTAEKAAPTHAHPAAAGSTVAQYALGPFASLLDHARDALKKATS
jgi:hemerythrin superfamily protein